MISNEELIENILQWNTTARLQTELSIQNTRDENYNHTNEVYEIISAEDAAIENITMGCRNNSELCVSTDYDSVEISVVIILFVLIVVTVIGNTLIISAVVTTKRLRTVTNCFVTSLAAADLLVGIFVMPPAIAVHITGE